MVYLLDANVIITAKDSYYAIDQVPQFWDWLLHQGRSGHVKIPLEVFEEVSAGRDTAHPFYSWRRDNGTAEALVLQEEVNPAYVQRVLNEGYAPDLTDDEIAQIGRDPFLVAYALGHPNRIIVTTEASKPTATRQNRRLPDVCRQFSINCINTFQMTRALGWNTNWNS